MNVFIVGSPLETAMALDKLRLNKQIVETQQILDALNGKKAWSHHPCTLQYEGYEQWLENYMSCLMWYRLGDIERAAINSEWCDLDRPPFHTEEFFAQMKRRLYTKDNNHYVEWADLGPSNENWYWSPSEQKIIKYVNGKRV